MFVQCAKVLKLLGSKGVLGEVKVEMRSLVVVAVAVAVGVLNFIENIVGVDMYDLI